MYNPIYWRCFSEMLKKNFFPIPMMLKVSPLAKDGDQDPGSSLSPSKSAGVVLSISFNNASLLLGNNFIHRTDCTAELQPNCSVHSSLADFS